jgi:hypothetical protein
MVAMPRLTIRRLLVATFCFGVALAVLQWRTQEPWAIVAASLAIGYAALAVFYDSRWTRTERTATMFLVSVMLASMVFLGAVFALLVL